MIHKIDILGTTLAVTWDDGSTSAFHQRWLRDNCQSPAAMHSSGQRLIETSDIPADIQAEAVHVDDGGVVIIHWHGQNHVSEFPAVWLYDHRFRPAGTQTSAIASSKEVLDNLWDSSLATNDFTFAYADVSQNLAAQVGWLSAFVAYGVTVLQGVPTSSGMVAEVASLFGYVRETNYGRHFDVKSVINPNNLAYTGLALSPHTDNPYRDPVPTIQLLHCLESEVSGGDSTVVDGFYVAHKLQDRDPAAFALLSSVPAQFRFQDDETDLLAEKTIIGLDSGGDVNCVSFNNRSIQPFQVPPEQMGAFYDAYTTFAQMVNDPQNQITFKLSPGELFMVDNRRVLHGRTGYVSDGSRHLQGCYADVDGLRSRLAVLRRL